jgi:predicted Fe-Mo cluster-binding NifX family protein
MKIAFSSFGPNLMSQLSPRVRGCRYLLIVDTSNMHLEVFDNKRKDREDSDGRQAVQFIISSKVNALITGRCRQDTFRILTDAGIHVYLNQSGTVKEVLEKYTLGRLRPAKSPTAHKGSSNTKNHR